MTALPAIANVQGALNARFTAPSLTVYVGGVTVDVISWSAQHDAGSTATGRLAMILPRNTAIQPNATIEVQGGHNDFIGTVFSGYIPNWEGSIASRGNLLNVSLVGWSELLKEPFREDVVFPGPVALDAVFVALCQLAGVPSWIAEQPTYADLETPVMLGGNNAVDDGAFIVKADTSPLSQLQRVAKEYRYWVSDTPQGPVLLHRIGGLPGTTAAATFTEGLHLISGRRSYDVRGIVNVWDINGVTYEDEFGGRVPIRSIADPDAVEPHDEIVGGYRYKRVQNSDIVRQDQADAIREWYEIDNSEATAPVKWEAVGLPGLAPGDVVTIDADTIEADGTYWLMGIDAGYDDGGYTATYEGWAGAGEELPGIVDRVTIDIQTAAVHLGDETRSNYAHPAPQGTSMQWAFSLPAKVSAANVRGWGHGWNSQLIGGVQTDLQVSKWEVWLAGVDQSNRDNRPESSGNMPIMNEEIAARRPYATGLTWWSQFAINLRSLDAGDYVLKLVCGQKAGYDDGEVQQVYLELYGTVEAAGSDA